MELTLGFIAQLARLTQPIWFAVTLATGFILFAPSDLAERLSVDGIRAEYSSAIGLCFIVSLSLSLVSTAQALLKFIRAVRIRRASVRRRHEYLRSLTPAEKAYLLPFIEGGENTQLWQVNDGIAGGLLRKKIVYRSSDIFFMVEGVSYNLQPWARVLLQHEPELLQGYDSGFLPGQREEFWRI